MDNLSVKRQKGRISKRLLQEKKACQIFRKTRISYPLIRLRAWDLLFCLIAAELWYYEVCFWNKSLWLGKLIHLKTFFFCSNSFFCFSLFSQENKFIRVASFDRGCFVMNGSEWFRICLSLQDDIRVTCYLWLEWRTVEKKLKHFFSEFSLANIHDSQDSRGGYLFNVSLPRPPASQALRHQPGDYCR